MPLYKPTGKSYGDYFLPITTLPTVKLETASLSAFDLHKLGIRSEGAPSFIRNAGEEERALKGGYILTTERIQTATGEYEVEVTRLAIEDNAQIIVSNDDSRDGLSREDKLRAQEEQAALVEATQQANLERNAHISLEENQYETAPNYDPYYEEDPVYEPENAPPPVYYEETPEEIQNPEEPTQELTWYELRDLEETGGYAGDSGGGGGEDPYGEGGGGSW